MLDDDVEAEDDAFELVFPDVGLLGTETEGCRCCGIGS
jgi:hypothetical protein